MKRTVALTLILVVLLLGAFSSSAGARDTGQLSPADTFHALTALAARPASGQDMYENIHEYMWKQVYVMGTVDYAVPATDDRPVYFYPHLARRRPQGLPLPRCRFRDR